MIRVVAMYGSPRRNHNSDILLNKVIEGIGNDVTVNKIYAASPDIQPCTSCSGCFKEGRCVIKDEMQEIYALWDKADIVLSGSPVYFHTVTAQMKKLIDRSQAVWAGKFVANNSLVEKRPRLGYIICTAGPPEEKTEFDCAVKVLDLFHKCINARITGKLTVANVDQQPVKGRADILAEAVKEGKKLRKMMEEIKKLP